jgi:hypothetical protein
MPSEAPKCRDCKGRGSCPKCWDLPAEWQKSCETCGGKNQCPSCSGTGQAAAQKAEAGADDLDDDIPF